MSSLAGEFANALRGVKRGCDAFPLAFDTCSVLRNTYWIHGDLLRIHSYVVGLNDLVLESANHNGLQWIGHPRNQILRKVVINDEIIAAPGI
ncbi:hypothetical protein A5709_23065 [Mycobacterium sp. E1386]|nr:hypothetical protein A5709_23065 [Mycobacterium sp. E1386]